VIAFLVGGLTLLSASRLALTLAYLARLQAVDGFLRLFPIGIRMDTSLLCVVLAAPAAAVLLLPRRLGRWWHPLVAAYLAGAAAIVAFLEFATLPFLAQYDSRPNRIFRDYLGYPHEVAGTLWAGFWLALAGGVLVVVVVGSLAWRASRALLREHAAWPCAVRLLTLPLVAGALVLGMRSSLGPRPANISTAAFSSDHLANELALDSAYPSVTRSTRDGTRSIRDASTAACPRPRRSPACGARRCSPRARSPIRTSRSSTTSARPSRASGRTTW
jgi:phosphoglycerol transferase MdoB-like AlkP superfamily enzyme